MNVLVVGNGGREHALAWTLLRSPNVQRVICAPGNGGTATLKGCQNEPVAVDDFEGIKRIAQEYNVSLVVVGPEVPLALGIADYLQQYNIPVFGPNRAGAQLEASKAWAKDLMGQARIPPPKPPFLPMRRRRKPTFKPCRLLSKPRVWPREKASRLPSARKSPTPPSMRFLQEFLAAKTKLLSLKNI